MDRVVAKPDRLCLRIELRPPPLVDISLDCDDRRNLAKSADDFRTADVTGMDDVVDAGEMLLGLGAQQPVRIRDDSNSQHDARPDCLKLCLKHLSTAKFTSLSPRHSSVLA